jgi:hypothetical protein
MREEKIRTEAKKAVYGTLGNENNKGTMTSKDE